MSVALKQIARSPRVLRTHFPAYACRIYITALRARFGLYRNMPAHPAVLPLSASCSSGQRFAFGFLQIPPRDGHPCRSANTSPCRVCRGLSPPSECALPGAQKEKPLGLERLFQILSLNRRSVAARLSRHAHGHSPTCIDRTKAGRIGNLNHSEIPKLQQMLSRRKVGFPARRGNSRAHEIAGGRRLCAC